MGFNIKQLQRHRFPPLLSGWGGSVQFGELHKISLLIVKEIGTLSRPLALQWNAPTPVHGSSNKDLLSSYYLSPQYHSQYLPSPDPTLKYTYLLTRHKPLLLWHLRYYVYYPLSTTTPLAKSWQMKVGKFRTSRHLEVSLQTSKNYRKLPFNKTHTALPT